MVNTHVGYAQEMNQKEMFQYKWKNYLCKLFLKAEGSKLQKKNNKNDD